MICIRMQWVFVRGLSLFQDVVAFRKVCSGKFFFGASDASTPSSPSPILTESPTHHPVTPVKAEPRPWEQDVLMDANTEARWVTLAKFRSSFGSYASMRNNATGKAYLDWTHDIFHKDHPKVTLITP